jgi:hypothetical protein
MESHVLRVIRTLVEQDAYLRSAVRYGGRIFKGDQGEPHIMVAKRHLPFSHLVKVNQDKDFGFVNHKGHYLNRQQAGEYASVTTLRPRLIIHGSLHLRKDIQFFSGLKENPIHSSVRALGIYTRLLPFILSILSIFTRVKDGNHWRVQRIVKEAES